MAVMAPTMMTNGGMDSTGCRGRAIATRGASVVDVELGQTRAWEVDARERARARATRARRARTPRARDLDAVEARGRRTHHCVCAGVAMCDSRRAGERERSAALEN